MELFAVWGVQYRIGHVTLCNACPLTAIVVLVDGLQPAHVIVSVGYHVHV